MLSIFFLPIKLLRKSEVRKGGGSFFIESEEKMIDAYGCAKPVAGTILWMGMENVVIFRTFDLAEAQLVRGRLEGAGFRADLAHENSAANFDVAGGGVR